MCSVVFGDVVYHQNPVQKMHESNQRYLYVWMTEEALGKRLDYARTHDGRFESGSRNVVFAWHTPLGAIAVKDSKIYGNVLVKLRIRNDARITQIYDRDYFAGEKDVHFYQQTHTVFQFQEWILNSKTIESWSAFTQEIRTDIERDVQRYKQGTIPSADRHAISERHFDPEKARQIAIDVLRNFSKGNPYDSSCSNLLHQQIQDN